MKYTAILTPLLLTSSSIATARKSPSISSSTSRTPLQFASPLQSFTIFDKSSSGSSSPRSKFLPRLRAGLLGERRAREVVNNELRSYSSSTSSSDGGWAEHSAQQEELRKKAIDKKIERGYDEATRIYDRKLAARLAAASSTADKNKSKSLYQLVGVINTNKSNKKEVTWYARPKPYNSNWNIRLIHVNRDAVLRDLFVKGKIDLFGGYRNQGMGVSGGDSGEDKVGVEGRKPRVLGEYTVKERSWRTLWNFSPIRFFTTSSGSYHRERRLTPGIYTDGSTVYETVYRYRDGKNGMKPLGSLEKYLEKGDNDVEGILKRLAEGVPDVVIEK